MTGKDIPPIRRIEHKEMCRMFNEGNYWQRAKDGEFTEVVRDDRHPSLIEAPVPFCTYSQMVSYLDRDDNEVARVHQYLKPDKTLGASGLPDPKRMLVDGVLYRLHKKPKEQSNEEQPGNEGQQQPDDSV